MVTAMQEREVIELPDFYSHAEMVKFVTFLEENRERYGVKSLLYYSKMILGHLERIDNHAVSAGKILIRVNGSITEKQKQGYKRRVLETPARKFYNSRSDNDLNGMLAGEGYASMAMLEGEREKKVQLLVDIHVQRELERKEG